MSIDEMEPMGQAGVLLGLIGGVLGLVPQLERALAGAPGWSEAGVLAGLALAMLIGSGMALKRYTATGSLIVGIGGLALGTFGPTMPGVLGVIAGVLLFLHAGKTETAAQERSKETQTTRETATTQG